VHLATGSIVTTKFEFHVFILLTPCHTILRHNPEDHSMKINRSIFTATSSSDCPNQRHLI